MTNPFATQAASNFGLMLARGTLGLYFAAIGYKGVMGGVSNFARRYVDTLPGWFKPQYGEVFLTLYPVVQITAGVLLTLGIFTRMSAFLLASTLLVFMFCIEGFKAPSGWEFNPNLIFLGCTIALLTNGGGNLTIPGILGKKSSGGAGGKAPTPATAK